LEAHYGMKVYERPNEKSGCILGFREFRELLLRHYAQQSLDALLGAKRTSDIQP
jgi:hypothetical protein